MALCIDEQWSVALGSDRGGLLVARSTIWINNPISNGLLVSGLSYYLPLEVNPALLPAASRAHDGASDGGGDGVRTLALPLGSYPLAKARLCAPVGPRHGVWLPRPFEHASEGGLFLVGCDVLASEAGALKEASAMRLTVRSLVRASLLNATLTISDSKGGATELPVAPGEAASLRRLPSNLCHRIDVEAGTYVWCFDRLPGGAAFSAIICRRGGDPAGGRKEWPPSEATWRPAWGEEGGPPLHRVEATVEVDGADVSGEHALGGRYALPPRPAGGAAQQGGAAAIPRMVYSVSFVQFVTE